MIFGFAAQAAATTLAVFFLGLAAGGYAWGRRTAKLKRPLRTYAVLEVGIAVSALLYFALHQLFGMVFPTLFKLAGGQAMILLAGKFLLATVILFPAAFFMGGTLPVMGQYMVRHASQLGSRASLLYLVNTAGAAGGAFAAGFLLPPVLGYLLSYLLAIILNLIVAGVAWGLDLRPSPEPVAASLAPATSPPRESIPVSDRGILVLAGVSGILTLALEVLWTRMFAQVLQNSVYTYSLILTLFLLALAAGSGLARFLCSRAWSQLGILAGLLLVSGLVTGLVPGLFRVMTGGMSLLAVDKGWTDYMMHLWGLGAVTILPAGLTLGAIFPYLLRVSEGRMTSAGWTIGKLVSVNTSGAILGSLVAGFLLLDLIGLWGSLWLISVLYLLTGAWILQHRTRRPLAFLPVALGFGLVSVTAISGNRSLVKLDDPTERVIHLEEGVHGTVAVIDRHPPHFWTGVYRMSQKLDSVPVNRDDRPVIENLAPKIERNRHGEERLRALGTPAE